MTNDQIRIEVAKATGWTKHREGWHHSVLCHEGGRPTPPDYLNDLNACRDAWETLSSKDQYTFSLVLAYSFPVGEMWKFPTARQCCEGFLRVKGLWKEA